MPATVTIHGESEANQLVAKRMSPRAHRLAWLERWVDGTQYDGMPSWWDDSVPVNEKAPCIVDPIAADAIESHADMVLGDQRFPAITSRPSEDESEDSEGSPDAEDGLNEKDSAALDKLMSGISEQVRFRALSREALEMAMGCGTSVAIYGARAGRLFGDTVKARWCEPEFAEDAKTVKKLVIQYPYLETYQARGEWHMRARIYRRVIDEKLDTTYKPADASLDPASIKWEELEQSKVTHGLGFCPVIWYPFFRGCSIAGQIDGRAPHANLTDEIHCHDISLSQRHRAARYCGDPQWTEIGVDPGYNPSQSVPAERVLVTQKGGEPTADNPVVASIGPTRAQSGPMRRKKGPGNVWQYDSPNVKVELHQLSGDALKAISEDGADLRLKIMQALAYVPLDPESSRVLRGSLSGKALDSLRERQLNRDDRIRDDFGDGFLIPSMSMLLRICHVKGDSLRVRGLKGARRVLAGFDTGLTNAVA